MKLYNEIVEQRSLLITADLNDIQQYHEQKDHLHATFSMLQTLLMSTSWICWLVETLSLLH